MDAFADKARAVADEVIALVKQGAVRERIVEKLENAMQHANARWQRDQAMAPPQHDPFPQQSDGGSDAA